MTQIYAKFKLEGKESEMTVSYLPVYEFMRLDTKQFQHSPTHVGVVPYRDGRLYVIDADVIVEEYGVFQVYMNSEDLAADSMEEMESLNAQNRAYTIEIY